MGIPLHHQNPEHRVLSSDRLVVEETATLTTLVLLVDQEVHPEAEAEVEVRHPSVKSPVHRVHPGVEVLRQSGKREGHHVVRKIGRSLLLQLRRNVEVDLLVRGRGTMWDLDLVDGKVTESRKRGGLRGRSSERFIYCC
jgi:hypothetical protein